MAQQSVTVTGNLTAHPEIRKVQGESGHVTTLRLAASRTVRNRNRDEANPHEEEWITYDQLFIDAVCWGQLACNVAQSLAKGMAVVATGTLVTEEWEDPSYTNAAGQTLRRQKIRLKVSHLGLDLNRYIISSSRTDLRVHKVEGLEPPTPSDLDALVAQSEQRREERMPGGGEQTSASAAGRQEAPPF